MNNSLQLLMVLKYIMEKASESNPITNADIMEFLKCNKVNPCKKTLISMIKSIKEAGFDLITVKEKRTNMYYIPSEHFDTTEARLLIDSVISAKFVTPKKAEILLEKLVGLSDRDMLLQYMKDIVVENRQKHRNCYSYYSIDVIQEALSPSYYSTVRTKLDSQINSNVDTAAEEFGMYHGVKVYSSINLPTGIDFLLMHTDTVGQPVIVNQYSEPEKIQLSNDYAVSLFYDYGTKALTPDLLFKRSAPTEAGGN